MTEKHLNTRIVHKHDIEANWLKAINFIPKAGELIVYDADENFNYARVKIGDGALGVNELPFVAKRADWNENDIESEAYVANRTHWKETEFNYESYLEDQEIYPTSDSFLHTVVIPSLEEFNGKYLVEFDEEEYICQSFMTYDGYPALGDSRIYYSEDTTNQENVPFCIIYDTGSWDIISGPNGTFMLTDNHLKVYPADGDGEKSHTIEIKKLNEILTYHPLDEKYIPDSIARTEEVMIYKQPEAPEDAPVGTLWVDTDESPESKEALPPYTTEDNNKLLQIVDGVPTWVLFRSASEVNF